MNSTNLFVFANKQTQKATLSFIQSNSQMEFNIRKCHLPLLIATIAHFCCHIAAIRLHLNESENKCRCAIYVDIGGRMAPVWIDLLGDLAFRYLYIDERQLVRAINKQQMEKFLMEKLRQNRQFQVAGRPAMFALDKIKANQSCFRAIRSSIGMAGCAEHPIEDENGTLR